eukprot:SAG31_NODE_11569_length_1017_cov_0.889978_2_plen_58_part_01
MRALPRMTSKRSGRSCVRAGALQLPLIGASDRKLSPDVSDGFIVSGRADASPRFSRQQ